MPKPLLPTKQGTYAALGFDLLAAGYSTQLDRIVTVSKSPAMLRVLKGSGEIQLSVPLSAAPAALSVSPDGKRAAVSHQTAISLVDLTSGSIATLAAPGGVDSLIDPGGAWLYITGRQNGEELSKYGLYSVEVATGTITRVETAMPPAQGAPLSLNAAARTLFVGSDTQIDISAAPTLQVLKAGPLCSPLYSTADGTELLSSCARVYRQDPANPQSAPTYRTALKSEDLMLQAAHDAKHKQFAAIFKEHVGSARPPEIRENIAREVRVFEDRYLDEVAVATLPDYTENGTTAPLEAQWLGYSADGESLYVLAHTPAGSQLSGRTAIVTLPSVLASGPAPQTLDDAGDYALLHASVIDAQRSQALDKLVIVTATPAQLIVLDPNTGEQTKLALPRSPEQLLLSASGRKAVLVYNGWIAYYQLDPLTWKRDVELQSSFRNLGLDEDYVYLSSTRSIELETGRNVQRDDGKDVYVEDGFGQYVPNEHAFYRPFGDRYARIQAHSGLVESSTSISVDAEFEPCSQWWIFGDRGVTACGRLFKVGAELGYRGTLAGLDEASYSRYDLISHLDRSSASQLIALVESYASGYSATRYAAVRLYDDRSLQLVASAHLPPFAAAGKPVAAYPGFAFFSKDGKRLDVLAQADPMARVQQDYGLTHIDLTQLARCPVAPDAPQPEGVETGQIKLEPIDFNVVAAAVSRKIERFVVVSNDPPRLRLLDTATAEVSAQIDLPYAPTALELAPDGRSAYVGHDAWLSHVSLDPLEISATHAIGTRARSICLAEKKALIVPPTENASNAIRVLDLETGLESKGMLAAQMFYRTWIEQHSLLRSGPALSSMPIQDALNRNQVANEIVLAEDVGYRFWFSADGTRLIGESGKIFDLQHRELNMNALPPTEQFVRLGILSMPIRSLDQSLARKQLAVVRSTSDPTHDVFLAVFDSENYGKLLDIELPRFRVGQTDVPVHATSMFFSKDADRIFAFVEAVSDQPLRSRFGLVRLQSP